MAGTLVAPTTDDVVEEEEVQIEDEEESDIQKHAPILFGRPSVRLRSTVSATFPSDLGASGAS